jgi:hypothetical protein
MGGLAKFVRPLASRSLLLASFPYCALCLLSAQASLGNTASSITSGARKTLANTRAAYQLRPLKPSAYEPAFERNGLERSVRNPIQVRSTEATRVDVTLEVGTIVGSVELSAGAHMLDIESTTTARPVTGEQQPTIDGEPLRGSGGIRG